MFVKLLVVAVLAALAVGLVARSSHGASKLLDEIVASKPRHEHTRYHSVDELRQHGLQQLRDAVGLLEEKATPSEVDDYRRFVITLANSVATARHKDGHPISDAEGAAIEDISSGLGSDASKARL